MPRGKVPLLLLLACALPLAACGRPERPVVRPLWPELYAIDPEDVPHAGEFIRYAPPGPKGGGLDIAVTEYVSEGPGMPRLQLVGAVHVADRIYYEHLQAVLDRADLVLYEAIKPEAGTMEEWKAAMVPENPGDFVGFQQELAAWFGFQYQLDGIDYAGKRFVHADMTAEQFRAEGGAELMDEHDLNVGGGDTDALDPEVKTVVDKIRSFGRLLLSEPNPIRSLARRAMAEALGRIDQVDALGMFPGLNELVIDKRNAVVMQTLEPYLHTTSGTIAIFYGAAHNADLERRILALGYRRASGFWVRAWALRPPLR